MKIAVTSIAKNEEQFVERWVLSAKDADQIILIDTGSTDNTVERFNEVCQEHDINGVCHTINVTPWRFDIARNSGLALIPTKIDWVIDLDLDEVLVDGWRKAMEQGFKDFPEATRFRYPFVWSWNDDGTPAVQFKSDKIRTRNNYRWKHPVHECLYYCGSLQERFGECDVNIHHYPDTTKPRSQYLHLLKLAVDESPEDDRMAHYYARELYFHDRYDEAIPEFERHLKLESALWPPERAMSMVYLARIYYAKNIKDMALKYARLAVAENPNAREPWMALAEIAHFTKEHGEAFHAVVHALRITDHGMIYMSDPKAWGTYLYDIGSTSAYCVGNNAMALKWSDQAIEIEPENERLLENNRKLRQAIAVD